MKEHTFELSTLIKQTPPMAIAASSFFAGIQWNEVLYIVSAIWVVVQMTGYIYDRYKRSRKD